MTKKSWAKGRSEKFFTISVSEETIELVRKISESEKITMKELIATIVKMYDKTRT
jgi:hypothetical protein